MPNPDQEHVDGSPQKPSVWVVDDSALEREVIGKALEHEHRVSMFGDGSTVIEAIAAGTQPDVLVLDWQMPGMTGLEVCRFLRERQDGATLPVLVLTAGSGGDDVLQALAAGANDFVVKSASSAELVARVRNLARNRALHAEARGSELRATMAFEAADAANRANEVFLAIVSHELRTPLNSILGWAQLLADEGLDRATQRQAVTAIQRGARAQVRLVEDILDTTRVVTGKLHLEATAVDFARVVRDAVDATKPAATAKQHSVQVQLEGQSFQLSGDYDRLQQAVANVLTNAIKFTPERGRIVVRLSAAPNEWLLSVTDTGRGIGASLLPHVFDRFRQRDTTATREKSGLGLGLALVRHIVEGHGGTVHVTSEGEGSGTSVLIRLPHEKEPRRRPPSLIPAAMGVETEAVADPRRLAGLRILIVEDDDDSRALLATVLSRLGANVAQADSSDAALELLSRSTPDALVSDIGLPGRSGHELVSLLRARGLSAERLPAIALTAYARAEERARATQAGFQDFVSKPLDIETLVVAIERLTSRR